MFNSAKYKVYRKVFKDIDGVRKPFDDVMTVTASIHETQKKDDIIKFKGSGYKPNKFIKIFTDTELLSDIDEIVYKNDRYKILSAPENARGLLYKFQCIAGQDAK